MTVFHEVTGNVRRLAGVPTGKRARVMVISSVPKPGIIVDTDGDQLLIGDMEVAVDPGTGDFTIPNLIDYNDVDTQPFHVKYMVFISYPVVTVQGNTTTAVWDSGWLMITEDADLADPSLLPGQYSPPEWQSGFMAQATALMNSKIAEVEAIRDYVDDVSNIALPDSLITAIDSNPASAFRQQQDARLLTSIEAATDPLDVRLTDLEETPPGSAADRGEGFVSKLDVKAATAVIAVIGDSTSYKNGSSLYVGTDGFEWPRKLAEWIADTYPTAKVDYHALASWVNYASEVVVSTGQSTETVLSDTFTGSAGALAGQLPTTGTAWSGAGYNKDGSGNAVQAANTATTAGFSRTGRPHTVIAYELVPTVSGTVNMLGSWTSSSVIPAWMTDNSTDLVDCKVTFAGVTTTVRTFTYAEAGASATVTGDVTAEIDCSVPGQITFKLGAATPYTHILAAGQDAVVAASSRAGMSGTRVNHKIRSITTTVTTDPDTTVEVYNGAFSSKDAQNSNASFASLVPVAPDVLIISHSHNHEAESAATFEAALDTLVATARAAYPNVAIVIASQNPETSATTNYVAHNARQADLRRYARVRGFGYIPVFEAFQAETNPASFMIADGLHPTPAAVDKNGDTVISFFESLSLRPSA